MNFSISATNANANRHVNASTNTNVTVLAVGTSRGMGHDGKGFTIVELIVVIGVIVLLMGLLSPVLSKVRESAAATKCRSNLKNLGTGWAIYADASPDVMPAAVSLPAVIGSAPPDELTIMHVLREQIRERAVYECPSDDRSYFAQRGTSYEYLPGLAIALNPINAVELATVARENPEIVPILADAAQFHDAPQDIVSPNLTVYYDTHVDWLFDAIPSGS